MVGGELIQLRRRRCDQLLVIVAERDIPQARVAFYVLPPMDVINVDARAMPDYGWSLFTHRRQVGERVKEATQLTCLPRIGLLSHRLLPSNATSVLARSRYIS